MNHLLALVGIALLAGLLFYIKSNRKNASLHPLPPGPKPIPLVGNLMDLPPSGQPEFEHWLKFKNLYGPISSVTILGQTMIVLQERQIVEDLLEKMSKKTSGRPNLTFLKMAGFQDYLPAIPYDAYWRLQRRIFHQNLGTEKLAGQFSGTQDTESRRLLLRALRDPQDLIQHIKTFAGAIILKITYDYNINPEGIDPLVEKIEEMMNGFSEAFVPLAWMVDIMPPLRHIPGLPCHKTAQQLRAINKTVINQPYDLVKRRLVRGALRNSSITSQLIQENKETFDSDPQFEYCIKAIVGFLYGAGADTSSTSLVGFVLAMIKFPEVQKKAQEEIDRVVGPDRLPDLDDKERLPYVSAVAQEASRWFPIVPINTTHTADQEIQYRGYRIPKGSYLLVSNWALLHDPNVYPDPASFVPERFMEPRNEPSPLTAAFGHGRRICPGRYLALDTMFIAIARLLAAFTIRHAVDEKGSPLEAKLGFTAGLVSHPTDFPFEILPRTEAHAKLVRSLEKDCPWEEGDGKFLTE